MNIDSLGGSHVANGFANESEGPTVEKEAFLKLLVAQISNQDPLAPQESEQYMQQLTQFSTLEQLMTLNQGVDNLAVGQLSNNNQEAVSFVGREIMARGDQITLEDADLVPIRYQVEPSAEKVTVTIYDAAGEAVRQVQVPADRGSGTFEWDGTDDEGRSMRAGRYTVSIEATDAAGSPLSADTFLRGRVTGVRFDNGFPELMIGDRRLRMSDIIEVSG